MAQKIIRERERSPRRRICCCCMGTNPFLYSHTKSPISSSSEWTRCGGAVIVVVVPGAPLTCCTERRWKNKNVCAPVLLFFLFSLSVPSPFPTTTTTTTPVPAMVRLMVAEQMTTTTQRRPHRLLYMTKKGYCTLCTVFNKAPPPNIAPAAAAAAVYTQVEREREREQVSSS